MHLSNKFVTGVGETLYGITRVFSTSGQKLSIKVQILSYPCQRTLLLPSSMEASHEYKGEISLHFAI